jgi:NTE family protein
MPNQLPTIALALQGGGSHGAFTWGVLDRLLQDVTADRFRVAAVSGTSAGALNAALTVSGLVQGGPDLARRKLEDFWRAVSRSGFLGGNALFFNEPGPFGGFNLDWSPVAIALEAVGLVAPVLKVSIRINSAKNGLTCLYPTMRRDERRPVDQQRLPVGRREPTADVVP